MSFSRRRFLGRSLAASLGPFLLPSGLRASSEANSRLRVGFIGTGIQGRGLLRNFLRRDEVAVLAVCDVDTNRREDAQGTVEQHYGESRPAGWSGCAAYRDFRELLDRDDIDAVVVSTPDHWHAIQAVAACRTGKDVYCEKPLVQTIREGVALIEAVERHGRVLQTGSQQRSGREFRVACEIVRNGLVGRISRVETAFGGPGVPCDLPGQEPEPGLDWDLWLGPAPERPYHEILAPRGVHNHYPMWRAYREYGGGMVTDWGAHHVDIAHWGLGMDAAGPERILAPPDAAKAQHGARLIYPGDVELTHTASQDGHGVSFFGENGEVHVNRGRIHVLCDGETIARHWGGDGSLGEELDLLERDLLADASTRLQVSNDHVGDFLRCVRERAKPITHEEIGARSIIACHLMNLAYYHGRDFRWDAAKQDFADSSGDPSWLHYAYRGDWSLDA